MACSILIQGLRILRFRGDGQGRFNGRGLTKPQSRKRNGSCQAKQGRVRREAFPLMAAVYRKGTGCERAGRLENLQWFMKMSKTQFMITASEDGKQYFASTVYWCFSVHILWYNMWKDRRCDIILAYQGRNGWQRRKRKQSSSGTNHINHRLPESGLPLF